MKRQSLVDEYRQVEQELAQLQERAKGVGGLIEDFGLMLKRQPSGQLYQAGQAHYEFQDSHPTPQRYIDAMNIEAAFQLADEVRGTKAKLDGLLGRKRELGLA